MPIACADGASRPRLDKPDTGYAWVVCAACFLNQFISLGIPFSVGIYNVEFLDYFGQSKSETAWIFSINIGTLLGCGPIAAYLMERFSYRSVACVGAGLSTLGTLLMYFSTNVHHLYITYGLVTGFGYSLVYMPSAVLVGHYFEKYRSLTTGLCSSASFLTSLVLPFLYNHIIDKYTWRGSVFILAAINVHMLVFSALLRPVNYSEDHHNSQIDVNHDNESETKRLSLMTDTTNETVQRHKKEAREVIMCRHLSSEQLPRGQPAKFRSGENDINSMNRTSLVGHVMLDFQFVVYFISNLFWNVGTGTLVVITVDYLYENGIEKETANMVITFFGIGGLIGGAVVGLVGNLPCCNRLMMYIVVNVTAGIATLLFLVHTSFLYLALCNILFGLSMGAIVGLLVILSTDIIGIEKLGEAYGYLMFSNGVGNLAGPPLAGLLFDISGSYRSSIWLAGILNAAGGVVMLLIPLKRRLQSPQKASQSKTNNRMIRTPSQQMEELSPLSRDLDM